MGEARRRGTFEERKASASERARVRWERERAESRALFKQMTGRSADDVLETGRRAGSRAHMGALLAWLSTMEGGLKR